MEKNLFKYIWRHSKREQIAIFGLVVLAQIFYFASLNIPKSIINHGIEGKAFKAAPTVKFLVVDLPLPEFLGGSIRLFDGVALEQWPYLVAMSFLFLFMVVVNGQFKKGINTAKGRMGERMLRRLRYELYDRILLFPTSHFRKVKQAELATMVNNEVEPLGGFIGDAYVAPMFLGGQAATALLFIMLQSVWLGVIVVCVLGLQVFLIPKLRRPVLVLGKQRQLTARALSGRIAETADGAGEIHANGTSNWERADIAERLGRIFTIRFELFQKKFVAKFWNNFLAQLTPFTIYLVGGWLAINGHMDIGAVVGVLLAYKDLPPPIKELIDWDQQRQDTQIKYEQVVDQFEPDGMLPRDLQALPEAPPAPLTGPLELSQVALADESGARPLDGVAATVPLGRKVAVIGPPGGGKEALGHVLARQTKPTAGKVTVGGANLFDLPEAQAGARVAYVGQDVYLFPLSVRDNLMYGLKLRPTAPPQYDETTRRLRDDFLYESRRSGNPDYDPHADWNEYQLAGASGPQDIGLRVVEALKTVDLEEDIYQLGLRGTVDPARRPDVADAMLHAREELHKRLEDPSLKALVEPFDRERFNRNLTVGENLLFGVPVDAKRLDPANLAANKHVQATLDAAGLSGDFAAMGLKIAETMVELFADLPPGHPFFDQFSFISSDELPDYRLLIGRLGGKGVEAVSPADLRRLMALPFRYSEARHRLGLIDEAMEKRLLEARRSFAATLPPSLAGAIEFYDPERYAGPATIQDNILFGRIAYGQAAAEKRLGALIAEVLEGLSLRAAVVDVGLDYNVGNGGKRLSAAQRQKLGLARAVLKRPDVLVVNEASAVLDGAAEQRLIDSIVTACGERGLIWVLGRAQMAARFEHAMVLQGGKVAAEGDPKDLAAKPGPYADLVGAAA